MGPPGDSREVLRSGQKRERPAEELQQEPESQKDVGWYFHQGEKEEYRDESQHSRPRIQNEIGPHNAGHGAARTNGGNGGPPVGDDVDEPGDQAACQVEGEIAEMAEVAFDIVAENVKDPHVAKEVQPPAMKKNRTEEGDDLVNDAESGHKPWVEGMSGHQAVVDEKTLQVFAEAELKQEDERARHDDHVVDHGCS